MKVSITKKGDFYIVTGGLKRHTPIKTMSKEVANAVADARKRLLKKYPNQK